jgi:hypothetical protein
VRSLPPRAKRISSAGTRLPFLLVKLFTVELVLLASLDRVSTSRQGVASRMGLRWVLIALGRFGIRDLLRGPPNLDRPRYMNGVSVALDETAPEVSKRQVSPCRGLREGSSSSGR